jgi:hypothetical protein
MFDKKIKLCAPTEHDWYEVGQCKDFPGRNRCRFFPDGCKTCMDRFECLTNKEEYRPKVTAVFYACRKCPAVKEEGYVWEWTKHTMIYPDNVLDSRDGNHWIGMDEQKARDIKSKWENK